MSPTTPAHRAEFSVRCACGIEYHTSDAHIGKMLPCKCGRKVPIVRPADTPENTRRQSTGSTTGSTRSTSSAGSTRSTGSTGSRSSSVGPDGKRRRKIRKRRYVPGQLGLKFGQGGIWLERANGSVARWFATQLRPMFVGSIMVRSTAIVSWLFLLSTIASWWMMKYQSEQTIPATVIAYGPRFVALWPLALLVPVALLFLRQALWPLLISALIIAGPIMGYVVNVGTLSAKMPLVPAPGTFRMLTFNTQGGNSLAYDIGILLKEQAPDVATFQECGQKLFEALQAQKGWYSERYVNVCTASRWKIEAVDMMRRDDLARVAKLGFGGAGLVLRTVIDSPHGPLVVVNLHLETARHGLEAMLGQKGFIADDNPFNRDANKLEGIERVEPVDGATHERFRKNTIIRDAESERASRWVVSGIGEAPILIAGDFNLPVESTIFQKYWSSYVDAFETLGNGLGWTKREGRWLRIRIDHILSVKDGLVPKHVMVLQDYHSDHYPLIADYAWPVAKP